MHHYDSANIKLNIPNINKEQSWSRNEEYKNWGNYNVFCFKEGKPKYLISNIYICVYYLIVQIFFLGMLVLDQIAIEELSFKILARLIFFLTGNTFYYKLITTDMGILSIGDPIINLTEMSQFSNFCMDCKCIRNQNQRHCPGCNVCIEGSYVHLKISRMCITKHNYLYFIGVCVSTIFQACLLF